MTVPRVYEGNRFNQMEKLVRMTSLFEKVVYGEIDKPMLKYLSKINKFHFAMTTQCCTGHQGKKGQQAHISLRFNLDPDEVITKIIRPLQGSYGIDVHLMTEANRLRYVFWLDNKRWKEELNVLIELLGEIKEEVPKNERK